MAYQLTTASSPADVIAQIVAFAIAHGFSDEGTTVVTDTSFSPSRAVTLTRVKLGSIYWTFRVDPRAADGVNMIQCRMSYSITGGAYPTSANGQEYWTGMSLWAFPGPYPNLYLYCDGVTNAVHAALELTSGIFNHFSFGLIDKEETFTGGEYVTAGQHQWKNTVSPPYLYPDADNLRSGSSTPFAAGTPNPAGGFFDASTEGTSYIRSVPTGGATNNYGDFPAVGVYRNSISASFSGYGGFQDALLRDSPNIATLRTALFPLYAMVRNPVSGLWRVAGKLAGVRYCANNVVDNAEIVLTNWQVFPLIQRTGGDRLSCPNTGKYALAYNRVS